MLEIGISAAIVLAVIVALGWRMDAGAFLRQVGRAPVTTPRGFLARVKRRLLGGSKRGQGSE